MYRKVDKSNRIGGRQIQQQFGSFFSVPVCFLIFLLIIILSYCCHLICWDYFSIVLFLVKLHSQLFN